MEKKGARRQSTVVGTVSSRQPRDHDGGAWTRGKDTSAAKELTGHQRFTAPEWPPGPWAMWLPCKRSSSNARSRVWRTLYVLGRMWKISPPSHGPPSLHRHLIRSSLEFKQLPLTPPCGSAIKERVLSITKSSWKRFLHMCTNEKANETPEGLQTNKPQECLWVFFFPHDQHRASCVCHLASFSSCSLNLHRKEMQK